MSEQVGREKQNVLDCLMKISCQGAAVIKYLQHTEKGLKEIYVPGRKVKRIFSRKCFSSMKY